MVSESDFARWQKLPALYTSMNDWLIHCGRIKMMVASIYTNLI